jgi:hypothetical protein
MTTTDPAWFSTVSARIAAEGRAITREGDQFGADLGSVGLYARFGSDGATIRGADGDALSLRTARWGREGALVPFDVGDPELGACTADLDAQGRCIQRLELEGRGFTEWWIGMGTGLEQGWVIDQPPAGEGPLVVDVDVDGALLIEGGGAGAAITDGAGRAWSVGSIRAWDADGEALDARVAVVEEGLRIEVDDADARFPVTIDPVYTTAAWTGEGEATGDEFGSSVSGAGDVNRDGYDDVIVGAPAYSSSTGRAYVYLGSASGLGTSAATTLTGEAIADSFGGSVSDAGDVNGDGYGDVIVGAAGYDAFTGRAYLYQGSATGLATSAETTLTGTAISEHFGYAVSGAGDVNGDGYDDVIVGAPLAGTTGGQASVYHGSSLGVASVATATLSGVAAGDYFGSAVSGAGDVDGDGYADVIVGASSHGADGAAYVSYGSGSGVGAAGADVLSGTASDSRCTGGAAGFGFSVSGAGDMNADGYADVIVGAPWRLLWDEDYDCITYVGEASVRLGSATGVGGGWTLVRDHSWLGYSVSDAGDVNGDGYNDIVVGDGGRGLADVYLGSATGLTSTTSLSGTWNSFGQTVSAAGDINGDGYADVILGDAGTGSGQAYVYLGYPDPADADGDGYDNVDGDGATVDCNDADPAIHPGAPETDCSDPTDYNCDGSAGHADADGDGFGACEDCNDSQDAINPAATETPGDALDEDCDGVELCLADADHDGYGADDGSTVPGASLACDGMGEVAAGGYLDCDDSDASVNPGADEVRGDEFDQDCNGQEDCFSDVDRDGYGVRTWSFVSRDMDCSDPGESTVFSDCDDAYATINPGAAEVCDSSNADEDCDGLADDADPSATGQSTFYADSDGDGYGGPTAAAAASCDPQTGFVATSTDCDDATSQVHPGAAEIVADDIDQDCDSVDSCYADADGDDHGGSDVVDGSTLSCATGAGSPVSTDCNDADATVNPDALELCDSSNTDEDCDGLADDADPSATGQSTFYADADDDGYGGPTTTASCDIRSGYYMTSTDCDDASSEVHPGAVEVVADGIDQDCDSVDSCYADADGDDYGTRIVVEGSSLSCSTGTGAPVSTDCNDDIWSIHPDAAEVCDTANTDEDCDGLADDADPSATGQSTFYSDADDDGYGGPTTAAYCDIPTGFITTSTDCDDTSSEVHPGAAEIVGDGIDQDCDTVDSCYQDLDGDNFGTRVVVEGSSLACSTGTGAVAATDCNDANATINPSATEVCDTANTDEDCDGLADDDDSSATGQSTFYADNDGDGYGGPTTGANCDAQTGFVTTSADCDDVDPAVNPDADDIPDDGVDQDCDGDDDATSSPACGGCSSARGADAGWSLLVGALALAARRRSRG